MWVRTRVVNSPGRNSPVYPLVRTFPCPFTFQLNFSSLPGPGKLDDEHINLSSHHIFYRAFRKIVKHEAILKYP